MSYKQEVTNKLNATNNLEELSIDEKEKAVRLAKSIMTSTKIVWFGDEFKEAVRSIKQDYFFCTGRRFFKVVFCNVPIGGGQASKLIESARIARRKWINGQPTQKLWTGTMAPFTRTHKSQILEMKVKFIK